jgi:hypothetical protein
LSSSASNGPALAFLTRWSKASIATRCRSDRKTINPATQRPGEMTDQMINDVNQSTRARPSS